MKYRELENIYANMYSQPIEEGWREKIAGGLLGAAALYGATHHSDNHKDSAGERGERKEWGDDYELGQREGTVKHPPTFQVSTKRISQLFNGDKVTLTVIIKSYLIHERHPFAVVKVSDFNVVVDGKPLIGLSELESQVLDARLLHNHEDDLAGWILKWLSAK